MHAKNCLFFLSMLLSALAHAQVSGRLGKQTDSTLALSFANKEINGKQFAALHEIVNHRSKAVMKRIDSANYDYVIMEEEIDTAKKTFRTVETYIYKGFESKECLDDNCAVPPLEYRGVREEDSKLIHDWPYKTIDALYPDPVIFHGSKFSAAARRKIRRIERREKRNGGYLSPVYKIITVINLKENTIHLVFLVPVKKVREIKYVSAVE